MSKELLEEKDREGQQEPVVKPKYPRHPTTMENTREETIRRMRAFPQRAAKLRELISALREADTR